MLTCFPPSPPLAHEVVAGEEHGGPDEENEEHDEGQPLHRAHHERLARVREVGRDARREAVRAGARDAVLE